MHGCTNSYCTTPMCKSCQKRVKNVPFRPPTPLAARIFAYYLATQDDPLAALCPHPLCVPPSEIGYAKGTFSTASVEQESVAKSGSSRDRTTDNGEHSADAGLHHMESFQEAARGQRAQQKDQVSLSQNLFDTAAIIESYYNPTWDIFNEKAHFKTERNSWPAETSATQRETIQIHARKLCHEQLEQDKSPEANSRSRK